MGCQTNTTPKEIPKDSTITQENNNSKTTTTTSVKELPPIEEVPIPSQDPTVNQDPIIEKNTGAIANCSDSDGGQVITVKGEVTDKVGNKYPDLCLNTRMIREYSCNSLGYKTDKDIYCAATDECLNGTGACLKMDPANACSDTDGGNVANVKGTVTDQQKDYIDYCIAPDKVTEYKCDDFTKHMKYQNILCANGCLDGACK